MLDGRVYVLGDSGQYFVLRKAKVRNGDRFGFELYLGESAGNFRIYTIIYIYTHK